MSLFGSGFLGSIVGAAGSALTGPLVAGGAALADMAFSSNEAGKQRRFQDTMSGTAYQRAVADMRAAGLNPALMYGSGSAATTPAGAMGSSPGSFGTARRQVMERLRLSQELRNLQATEGKDRANTRLMNLTGELTQAQTAKELIQADLARSQKYIADIDRMLKFSELPGALIEYNIDKLGSGGKYRKFDRQFPHGGPIANTARAIAFGQRVGDKIVAGSSSRRPLGTPDKNIKSQPPKPKKMTKQDWLDWLWQDYPR